MERKVIKGFRDKKDNYKTYVRGSKFKSSDKKRITELTEKGHLEAVETATPKSAKVETADVKHVEKEGYAVEDMTFDELKSLAKENDIEVKGTGKNGTVTRKDIEGALEKMTEKGE